MAHSINITEIQLYKALRQKLGEKEAEDLVTFVQTEVKAQVEQQGTIITNDIALLKDHIDMKFQQSDEKFATKKDLAETKADMIKWMFLFWVGQVIATFGFILLFLKK